MRRLSAPVHLSPILGAMDITAPRPELWTRIIALLGALRVFLRGAVPEDFDAVAAKARAHLLAVTAMVRRYIHILALEIVLPPPAVGVSSGDSNKTPTARQRREAPFRLTEEACQSRRSSASENADTPFIQWAMMLEAARRLALVMNHPEKHAKRLARLLRRRTGESLKDTPIPAGILRRLAPWTDALLLRLDEEARPEAWAGINSS